MSSTGADLWVFGYGSLMWRPGFEYIERVPALLTGYHRCFCIVSTHHRGSASRPGLVLGLDRGGTCRGVAYRVAASDAPSVHAYLRERELVNGVYREVVAPIDRLDGTAGRIHAVAYICERAHPSYAGRMSLSRQAFIIRGARGISGDNLDYLVNTVRHLRDSAIRERELERIVTLAAPHVDQLISLTGASSRLVSPSAAAIRKTVQRQPLAIRRMGKAERRRFTYRLRLSGG